MGTDAEMEEPIPTKDVELEEELYDGDDDFRPAEVTPESDDIGTGAIIASIHVESEQDDDKVIYIATIAASNNPKSDNITVMTELIKSKRTTKLGGVDSNHDLQVGQTSSLRPIPPRNGPRTQMSSQSSLGAVVKCPSKGKA
jgi:hypothetical protein